ncbi:MAG: HD-GYP domain-containing protein [Vicinamibacterales bacterium]
MTAEAVDWLKELGGAVAARQLYPSDHPRVADALGRLESLSERLTRHRLQVSLFSVDGRVGCDSDLLQAAPAGASRVFTLLAEHGYQRISLMRGVSKAELEQVVSGLVGRHVPGASHPRLGATQHVSFSALGAHEAHPDVADAVVASASFALAGGTQGLPAIWNRIGEERVLDVDSLEQVLEPLAGLTEAREQAMIPLASLRTHDEYTATHITNVAVLSMALAEAVGLPASTVRDLGVAALLHDIGKLRVDPSILNNPGRLDAAALAIIRRHPEDGARMLMETPGVPRLAIIVAFEHHIHVSGGGYPSVPAGWRVNLASSITHVCDVYDALRTNRPYRAGLEHSAILDTMQKDRGTVFAPGLLDAFFERVVPRTHLMPPADGPTETAS